MKHHAITLFILLLSATLPARALTALSLDRCLELAEENYPLIARYGLIEKTRDLNLSDINKGWLPHIGIHGQATGQNAVPGFPPTLDNIISQMGQEMRGMGRFQYKVGAEVSQTIYDGGSSKARRGAERASAEQSTSSVAVQLYAVREKVTDLFFGILLMDEQIALTESTAALLEANSRMMKSLLEGGVAMPSDVDMVEAQRLTIRQQLAEARSAAKSYRDLLALYIGEDVGQRTLERPDATMPTDLSPARPELSKMDAELKLNAARQAVSETAVMPRICFFGQAYGGYPGFNYFESMTDRKMSVNLLAGLKLSWNIDSFYTRANSRRRTTAAGEMIDNDRELFLFNTRLQATAQSDAIDGLKEVMADDRQIVDLRGRVRRAAEAQLANGVIDTTALLEKITDENRAQITAAYHEIQLLHQIYQLKHTVNR